jgi:hypothetical protein
LGLAPNVALVAVGMIVNVADKLHTLRDACPLQEVVVRNSYPFSVRLVHIPIFEVRDDEASGK